jgi:hypothetical protein
MLRRICAPDAMLQASAFDLKALAKQRKKTVIRDGLHLSDSFL